MNTPEGNRLTIAHPNARGTGCKIEMKLVPAKDGREGCISLYAKHQAATGWNEEGYAHASLGFTDVSKLMQVIRGETESINDGKGIYHYYGDRPVVFRMRHIIEPMPGYHIEMVDGGDKFSIILTTAEAVGIYYALQMALHRIAFG